MNLKTSFRITIFCVLASLFSSACIPGAKPGTDIVSSSIPPAIPVSQPGAPTPSAPQSTSVLPLRENPVESPTDQVIIRIRIPLDKGPISDKRMEEHMLNQLPNLTKSAGTRLDYKRVMGDGSYVLRLPSRLPVSELQKVVANLATSPEVISVEPDYIRYAVKIPDDPQFGEQWDLKEPSAGAYGINAPAAWDISTGVGSVVVAVVDTGILPNHPDLINRTLPGYDFISDVFTANDGNGRDADPTDPGDWVTAQDLCGFTASSSWHGSHVAGTIAAATNNAAGIAGINWVAKILPVRVLGKCGGYDSDIIDGLRWAAGLPVQGVPNNPNPARVINLSLGGSGSCTSNYQNTINDILSKGVIFSVAAGNSAQDASGFVPANCTGVISVAASDQNGNRASFSNYGNIVKISAPGVSILSTVSDGTTSPTTYSYKRYNGTSMAAPHIAGIVSLMLGIKPDLSPAEVLTLLQNNVTTFPAGSNCTVTTCGPGIANAAKVAQALGGNVIPPNLIFRNFIPATMRDHNPALTPAPAPTSVPTPSNTPPPPPTATQPPAGACKVGSSTNDAMNDAALPHVDALNLNSTLNGNVPTAIFKMRDVPATLSFNRTNVPLGAMEYWWGAFIDVDNNPMTGDPRSFYRGADYALILEYDTTGTPPFDAPVNSQVFALLYGWNTVFNDWWPLNYINYAVDPTADTLQVSGNVPGVSANSRIFWISFDFNPSGSSVYDWSDACVLTTAGAAAQSPIPEKFLR